MSATQLPTVDGPGRRVDERNLDGRRLVGTIETIVWGPLCGFFVYGLVRAMCVAHDVSLGSRRRARPS